MSAPVTGRFRAELELPDAVSAASAQRIQQRASSVSSRRAGSPGSLRIGPGVVAPELDRV